MRKPLVRVALLATAVTATLLPASATAATLATGDPVGDVWKSTFDPQTEEETLEPAGSQVNVDLERTVLKHTATRMVFSARYAELKRSTNRFFVFVEVRTNEGVRRDVGVDTSMRWGGAAFIMSGRGDVRCPGLSHAIDYTADTVTLSVPRSCLSKPRWVQGRIGALGFPEQSEGNEVFLDSGSDETADEPSWTTRIRRG